MNVVGIHHVGFYKWGKTVRKTVGLGEKMNESYKDGDDKNLVKLRRGQ